MTPIEMARIAAGILAVGGSRISLLTLQRLPKGFPRGEFMSETHKGKMCSFDAKRVLLFLIANDLVVPRIESDMLILRQPDDAVTPTD